MIKRFKIEKTKEVCDIIDKYSFCHPKYALTDFEAKAFKSLEYLSEYEKVLFFAYCELGSCRKVANLFGTNSTYANRSMNDLKKKVKEIVNTLGDD